MAGSGRRPPPCSNPNPSVAAAGQGACSRPDRREKHPHRREECSGEGTRGVSPGSPVCGIVKAMECCLVQGHVVAAPCVERVDRGADPPHAARQDAALED